MVAAQQFVLELAGTAELDAVRAFYASVGYGGGLAAGDRVVVARHDGAVVAAARLCEGGGALVLRGMYVAESLRGAGLGSRLLERVSAEIGEAACWCVPFAHLEEFYSRIGFRVCEGGGVPDFLVARKERYLAAGHAVVVMERCRGWGSRCE